MANATLQYYAYWAAILVVPFTIYSTYAVYQDRKAARQGKPLTHLFPLLKPQGYGAAVIIAEKGRVPLTYSTTSNALSTFWNIGRRLMLRPSSPKPAFVITRRDPDCKSSGSDDGGLGNSPTFRVELHPNESTTHFLRSFMMQLTSGARVVAICDPDDLDGANAAVQCHLVERIENRKHIRAAPNESSIVMQYADPELHPRGRKWTEKSRKVPDDAIWLVQAQPDSRGNFSDPPRFESRVAGRPRRRFFWHLMLALLVVPLIVIVLVVMIYVLESFTSRVSETDSPRFSTATLDVLYVFYSVGITLALIACMLYVLGFVISTWREERESCRWKAGTTECILDGVRARNLI